MLRFTIFLLLALVLGWQVGISLRDVETVTFVMTTSNIAHILQGAGFGFCIAFIVACGMIIWDKWVKLALILGATAVECVPIALGLLAAGSAAVAGYWGVSPANFADTLQATFAAMFGDPSKGNTNILGFMMMLYAFIMGFGAVAGRWWLNKFFTGLVKKYVKNP